MLLVAAALLAVNVVAEIVVAVGEVDDVQPMAGDINTSDPIDGLFGVATVAAVTALLPWRPDQDDAPAQALLAVERRASGVPQPVRHTR